MDVTQECIKAGPRCTPHLQEELTQLSFQTLYSVWEIYGDTGSFWDFSERIIKMLEKQVSRHIKLWRMSYQLAPESPGTIPSSHLRPSGCLPSNSIYLEISLEWRTNFTAL